MAAVCEKVACDLELTGGYYRSLQSNTKVVTIKESSNCFKYSRKMFFFQNDIT